MKIIILGAGVVGVSAAYVLGSRGHEVEVIERQAESGCETSFANGGQLSYSHAEPWANPGVLWKAAKWMFKEDAPLVFRPRADMDMIKMGPEIHHELLDGPHPFQQHEPAQARALQQEEDGAAAHVQRREIRQPPRRHIAYFSTQKDFEHAVEQAKFQARLGCPADICDTKKCIQLEPALEHAASPVLGGIFQPLDESGDAFLFTPGARQTLRQRISKRSFSYNTKLLGIKSKVRKRPHHGRRSPPARGCAPPMPISCRMGSYSPIYLKPDWHQRPYLSR